MTVLIIWPQPVWACSCVTNSIEDSYRGAWIVFEGEALSITSTESPFNNKIHLRVHQVYKGLPVKEVDVLTPSQGSLCGDTLKLGVKYPLFAYGEDIHHLEISSCGAIHGGPDEETGKAFLEESKRLREELDAAIAAQPENSRGLIQAKVTSLSFWHDFPQAEIELKKLLARNPTDMWALRQLIWVLYKQHRAKEVWDYYEDGLPQAHRDEILTLLSLEPDYKLGEALSYAALTLGKDMPQGFRYELTNTDFFQLERPRLNFSQSSLKKLKFHKGDLTGSTFSQGSLAEVEFIDINLNGAIFMGVEFDIARFGGGTLKGANFIKAKGTNVHMQGIDADAADFTDAQFTKSIFNGVNFKNAKMQGVKLENSLYDCTTSWPDGFDPVAAGAKFYNGACDRGLVFKP